MKGGSLSDVLLGVGRRGAKLAAPAASPLDPPLHLCGRHIVPLAVHCVGPRASLFRWGRGLLQQVTSARAPGLAETFLTLRRSLRFLLPYSPSCSLCFPACNCFFPFILQVLS